MLSRTEEDPVVSSDVRWSVTDAEIEDLQGFLVDTELPFKIGYLQLAFDNFEMSYETEKLALAFLSLVMALETLLNISRYELRYRVSRNTAVLLGEDWQNSTRIFKEVKELYTKRSDLVHTGDSIKVSANDLLKLRHYVREAIKEILRINKSKTEVLDILNCCGFGHRPWRK